MVAIVDYGLGNIRSVQKAVDRLGFKSIITRDPKELSSSEKLILPGVGHFANGMNNLHLYDLTTILNDLVLNQKIPILGICLGMQLMTEFSEEGNISGLGWIRGKTVRFSNQNMKVPHIGWNNVEVMKDHTLFNDLQLDDEFYFVHSYYVNCENEENILFKTNYGVNFDSGFEKGNILGVQFHPEKSHLSGLKVLKSFLSHSYV
jgi:imidazole glycerol-phosphate synthase subunit HisH